MSAHEHFMGQTIGGAATSGAAASVSWIAQANGILQLVATIIAIVAGLVALYPSAKKLWTYLRS